MKEILNSIVDILLEVPYINRQRMIGIMTPLRTEAQASAMLNYLEENRNNSEVMRIDTLIKTSLRISDTV